MNNLFSSFEAQTSSTFSLNWLALAIPILWMGGTMWISKSQSSTLFSAIGSYVRKELKAVVSPFSCSAVTMVSISLFWLIALINVTGLTPYTFTPTSHLSITVSLALSLWLGHMAYSSFVLPKSGLAHLVPLGTPVALMPFMVLIEVVSSVIRPVTLSVRLAANMIAGHLLMTLLGNSGSTPTLLVTSAVLAGLCLLVVLESAVALIQAYVFSVLSTLYLEDVNSSFL